jgi:hypothetical protein
MKAQRERYEAHGNSEPTPHQEPNPTSWLADRKQTVIGLVAIIALALVIVHSWHADVAAPTTSTADCNGHNGNAAVAACHPDDQTVQEACPDNSNGQAYAAPTETCLDAVP